MDLQTLNDLELSARFMSDMSVNTQLYRLIKKHIHTISNRTDIYNIMEIICNYFQVNLIKVLSGKDNEADFKKNNNLVKVKHTMMYFTRMFTIYKDAEITEIIGNHHYSYVNRATRIIRNNKDFIFSQHIENLTHKIRNFLKDGK